MLGSVARSLVRLSTAAASAAARRERALSQTARGLHLTRPVATNYHPKAQVCSS
jgi:hypothetical protein